MRYQIAGFTLACWVTGAMLASEPKPHAVPTDADARQQVLNMGKEWVAAESKHDEAVLRRILDDKFVATFGGGKKPYDKESFIRAILAGDADPTESQTLTDETVLIDGDTAVVIGTDTLHGIRNGAPYTEVARYTGTYIHRHGRWLALAEHMVDVPPPK
jgi:hypothetical protein